MMMTPLQHGIMKSIFKDGIFHPYPSSMSPAEKEEVAELVTLGEIEFDHELNGYVQVIK